MAKEEKGLNISIRSFITAILVLFVLMVLTYGLTLMFPGGIPFWKWLLSPVLVLGAEGNGSLIAILVFLLVIGGVFTCLDRCGLMRYMLDVITGRFAKNRYGLMMAVVGFFMAMGAFIGSFEECVPLVPIVVALAVRLGWDALTGLGMSLLAAGCGFASGVCNPFTVGVAQELAGLPMFSGIWMRMAAFVIIYGLLTVFLMHHAKKIEKTCDPAKIASAGYEKRTEMDRGLFWFVSIIGVGILLVLSSVFITALQDYTMIIVAVMFLVAGIVSVLAAGMRRNVLGRVFLEGVKSMLPALVMILMANSIKYTLVEAGIMDTLLQQAVLIAGTLPRWTVILFIYLIVLMMNFFIPSGSAKAFLLMPLIVPAAQVFGISAQLCVMAFAFGDGFSNVFYPTNPVLLISLGLADVDYVDWVRWSGRFQAVNLIVTCGLLLFGLVVGYC